MDEVSAPTPEVCDLVNVGAAAYLPTHPRPRPPGSGLTATTTTFCRYFTPKRLCACTLCSEGVPGASSPGPSRHARRAYPAAPGRGCEVDHRNTAEHAASGKLPE